MLVVTLDSLAKPSGSAQLDTDTVFIYLCSPRVVYDFTFSKHKLGILGFVFPECVYLYWNRSVLAHFLCIGQHAAICLVSQGQMGLLNLFLFLVNFPRRLRNFCRCEHAGFQIYQIVEKAKGYS